MAYCFCERAIPSEVTLIKKKKKALFLVAFPKMQPGNVKAQVVKLPSLKPPLYLPCADPPGMAFKKL